MYAWLMFYNVEFYIILPVIMFNKIIKHAKNNTSII